MFGEWIEGTLGDLIELKRGFDLPQQDRQTGDVPIVSSSGVTDHHSEAKVSGPGVVTGRYGTLGEVFYVDEDFWPLNTTLYVRDFKGNDPQFISYFLRGVDFLAFSDKAAVPGLNRNHLHQARVRYPVDAGEQRAIARILGALDKKIELNRRMGATLEGIARALFRSWFVEFDPVRAKADGRDPDLPQPIAELFPDRFTHSELGEIPVGWPVVSIGALAVPTVGGDWGADDPFDGAVECICLRGVDLELIRRTGWADAPRRWVTPRSVEKRALCDTDVIIASSGAGPTGRSIWAYPSLNRLWGLPVIYSNFCKRVRCQSPANAAFVDRSLQAMRESGEVWEYVNGTSVPNLDAGGLLAGKLVALPSTPLLSEFERISRLSMMKLQSKESQTLAAIRDALLPRLISGAIRVPEAERRLEVAPL